jgi:hypothetical protein
MKIDNIKEEVSPDMENLRIKESKRNTKHSRRPLQQTRASGRQNFRT